MRFDVAGLGNALVDALVQIPDDSVLEKLGLTRGLMHPVDHERWEELMAAVKDYGVEVHTGGSCANTIAALGLMGLDTTFCGQVGDDHLGRLYAKRMHEACGHECLHTSHEQPTGKVLALISQQDAERTMCTDLGASVQLPHIGTFAELIKDAKVLHVTGYLFLGGPMAEAAWEALEVAKAAGIPISLDVADPFVVGTVKDAMWRAVKDYADVVFLNAEEASALTGLEPHQAIEEVSKHARTVIVKLGSQGSLVCHDGVVERVEVHKTVAQDTTGAGDSYAAGFLYGFTRGWAPKQSGELGSRIAALTVAQVGAVVRDREALAGQIAAVSGVLAL
ncbi:MAG: adenosine kinase [Myxococcota bacterium]|nr:adenosine kinase [Myxococcota bacterium]